MSILPIPLCSSHPTSSSLSLKPIFTRSPLQARYASPSVSSVSSGSSGSYSSPSVFSLDDSTSSVASSAASSAVIPLLPGPFNEERDARSRRTFLNCGGTGVRRQPSQQDWEKTLPKEQLQNPRRSGRLLINRPDGCSSSSSSRVSALAPPSLLRQSERKVNFVDSLVDTAAQIVEAIWPDSTGSCSSGEGLERIIPLRTFIQETLKRSRTSYSTLQVALYYLIVLRPHIAASPQERKMHPNLHSAKALNCGRRMFLAALIIASKYLQDRNYSARAWSKISGLNTAEINVNESTFLTAVNWKLHISDIIFEKWTNIVLKHTPTSLPSDLKDGDPSSRERNRFSKLILALTPDLEISGADVFVTPEGSISQIYYPASRTSYVPSETYGEPRPAFLPPPLASAESRCAARGDIARANSLAYGFPAGKPGPRGFRDSCVTSDSLNHLSSSVNATCRSERASSILTSSPPHGYSESEGSVSSSPESTCSVFSKTSRSSSISSISSSTSPVNNTSSPLTHYRENSTKRPLCQDPESSIDHNAPSLRFTDAKITPGRRAEDFHQRLCLSDCSTPSAKPRAYCSRPIHKSSQGSPWHYASSSVCEHGREDVPSRNKRIRYQYTGSNVYSPETRDSLYV